MADYLSQKKQDIKQSRCTTEAEFIEIYKRASTRERDILWMKHRRLRQLFDEIEKNESYKGTLFR